MILKDLIHNDECTSYKDVGEIDIRKIATKISEIEENTLFVLIRSINFDVCNIINDIISKAPIIIISDIAIEDSQGIPVLMVENTRKILPFLFSRFYGIDYAKTRFVAITGTNGKTTTAKMLVHILRHSNVKTGFIGTGTVEIDGKKISEEYYSMTTPDPNLLYRYIKEMQNENCEVIVMEVSSHALYFDKVRAIPFEIGAFTNLSHEHIDFHKNIEEYYLAKLKLFENAKIGIFNADDRYSQIAYENTDISKRSVGIYSGEDAVATDILSADFYKTEYIYKSNSASFKVQFSMPGTYNVYNSIFAITIALELGVCKENIIRAMNTPMDLEGRFEIANEHSPMVIIDYAHTVKAFETMLKTVNSLKKQEQNVTVVFGCGGERDALKRPMMAKISEELADRIIVTSDNPRTEDERKIIEDILSGFINTSKRNVITSRKSAIENAILSSCDNDIVVIVGKGHERYTIDKDGYKHFDEREIIKNALKKRGEKNES